MRSTKSSKNYKFHSLLWLFLNQVYDGLETNTRCPHHSERYPDFCMSSIKEEQVDLQHAAVCSAETGHVYIVASENTKPSNNETRSVNVSDADTCDTFQLVSSPDASTWLHSITACLKGNLYHLGGTTSTDGPSFGYIWCSFDLQEFHTRYTESYKAGHSIWKTRLSSIEEEPKTNSHLHIYDVSTKSWMQYPEDPPFRVSGGRDTWYQGYIVRWLSLFPINQTFHKMENNKKMYFYFFAGTWIVNYQPCGSRRWIVDPVTITRSGWTTTWFGIPWISLLYF